MTKQEQKQEAIERMKMLKLYPNVIKEFEKENIVNLSENGGILYWLDKEKKKMVDDFEIEHDALVYHIIHSFTEIGELYSLFYVSKHKNEWETDREDLKDGYAFVYTKNVNDDWCSEFGSICIKSQLGGLVRVA